MWLSSKTVRAVLRDRKLRRHLLRDKELSEADYKTYDSLDQEKRDAVSENVINVLEAYAPFQIAYPSPVDEYPDDAQVYGTKGLYMVRTGDSIEFFSTKRSAVQIASTRSRVSWKIAREMGYLDAGE
jgi:hypothetical protein